MKNLPKQLRNSLIIGGIAGFASLSATGTPSVQNLYSAFIAMGMAFFVECANQYRLKGTTKKAQAKTLFF